MSRESGARRDSVVEMAEFPDMNPGPVLRLDLDGIVQRANAAASQVFRSDGLTGVCWLDLCPGMTPALWRAACDSATPSSHEAEIHGRCLIFTHVRRPGRDLGFVFGSDITERRRAERELAVQKAQLAELARFPEMNPGPVCRLDRDGVIALANSAARRLFADEALVGKCWLDVCPEMSRARWREVLAATAHWSHEVTVGDRYMLFTHTPGANEHDIFVYGADLTAQRTAERALRQAEKMATLGTLAAGVAHELNNPGAAARRAAEQLGEAFGKAQLAQVAVGRLSLDDAARDVIAELDRVARARACDPVALGALERSDREAAVEEWLEVRGVADAWELAPALVAMGHGGTTLEELAGRLGAEHAAPVVVWLARAYPVYALAEEIRHGTGRLAEIVGALKSYSYLRQGPVQAVDVNEGLRNTLIILRNKLKYGITVEQELAADLPVIQGYGGELNQVWTNLIDNGATALGGSGRIRLRTSRDGDAVRVAVEDDGPGIPAAIQSRIFDPFFTTKAPGEGTGLGLNTSYNIVVQQHGGAMTVESTPGRTVFTVHLPIEPPRRGQAPRTSPDT
jgi:signal transduction histidine kinase